MGRGKDEEELRRKDYDDALAKLQRNIVLYSRELESTPQDGSLRAYLTQEAGRKLADAATIVSHVRSELARARQKDTKSR